jgi:hypothetical protein
MKNIKILFNSHKQIKRFSQLATVKCLIFTILLSSCGPSAKEIAQMRLSRATLHFEAGEFNMAKLVIDSILENQSGLIEYTTRAEDLLSRIKIEEQKSNLAFLDSMLKIKEAELQPLMENFIPTSDYGQKTLLVHKRQRTENSYNRTYIRTHLESDGTFYISSYYSGSHHINHSSIKVYHQNQSIQTEDIPFDEFENRHFDDGENKWEVVNYKNGKDNGVIDFISKKIDLSLKAQFIGNKSSYIVLEKADKEAIRDGYEISFILRDITRIKKEKENSARELKLLTGSK